MAEREGFEPSVGISHARFPGVCLKPLSHLSADGCQCAFSVHEPAIFFPARSQPGPGSRRGVAPVSILRTPVSTADANECFLTFLIHLLVGGSSDNGDRRDACPTPLLTPSAQVQLHSYDFRRWQGGAGEGEGPTNDPGENTVTQAAAGIGAADRGETQPGRG